MALNDLPNLLIRKNSCIITYGHNSSLTSIGSDENVHSLGLIPLTLSWIFKQIEEHRANRGLEYKIKIAIIEIEKDQVFDLIDKDECRIDQISNIYKNVWDNRKALIYLDSALGNRKSHHSHLIVSLLIDSNDNQKEKSLSIY